MAESTSKILEGVFAISKPPSLSSAQVLRELQIAFENSQTFAPLLQDARRKREEQERHQPRKRRRGNEPPFKLGHGGTLDPLATGVLIVGIGRGTKHLQNFLGCTKTYETVVLFGKSTDTYDIAGKIVGDAKYGHVTRALVESKLEQFRGTIRQVPPVFSALRINGLRAYEYARAGKELPRELESREMQVEECELLEWYDGGKHNFRWPAEEAPEEEKKAVSKLMGTSEESAGPMKDEALNSDHKASIKVEEDLVETNDQPQTTPEIPTTSPKGETSPFLTFRSRSHSPDQATKLARHTHDPTLNLSSTPSPAPAALIRLTVSSGFYVRSFAHDLGHAVSSQAIMATLVRSRQADFTINTPRSSTTTTTTATTAQSSPSSSSPQPLIPALTFTEIQSGEEIWSPKLRPQLEHWLQTHPPTSAEEGKYINGRDPSVRAQIAEDRAERPRQRFRGEWTAETKADRKRQAGKWKGKWNEGGNRGRMNDDGFVRGGRGEDGEGEGETGKRGEQQQEGKEKRARVRNSSSPEE